MPDHILIQALMGGAALITFLNALNLLGSIIQYIKARAVKIEIETAKIKVETVILASTITQVKPGRNGKSNV